MRTSPWALLAAAPLVLAATSPAHAATPTLTTKKLKASILDTASYEEVYATLHHGTFTTGLNGLKKVGWHQLKGFSVRVTLKGKGKRATYCIEGWSGPSKHYKVDSHKPGKLTVGVCQPAPAVNPSASPTPAPSPAPSATPAAT